MLSFRQCFGSLLPRTCSLRYVSTKVTERSFAEELFSEEDQGLSAEQIREIRTIHRIKERMYTRKFKKEYHAQFDNDFKQKQLRKDYVNFGEKSGINGGICWPDKDEIQDLILIEQKFYPKFEEMLKKVKAVKNERAELATKREDEIQENLEKLSVWRKEMLAQDEKKKRVEDAEKAKMDELVREVREYIGYNVEPSDPRFQEVMEMKEQERKLREKEEKKRIKKEKLLAQMMSVHVAMEAESKEAKAKDNKTKENKAESKTKTDKKEKA